VRATERSCPFCGVALALVEPIEEFRLLTRLDRDRMVAVGAVLAAAGIALGCREQVVAVYGAPPNPIEVRSAAPSAQPVPPEAPPVAPEATPPPSASAASSPPPTAKPSATARAPVSPTGAPVAAYGAPPRMSGPELEPKKP
jgi:hypothetical protein